MAATNYWLSWYATTNNGPFKLEWPWWVTGGRITWDAKTRAEITSDTVCAAVRAESETVAREIILRAHDNPPAKIEWRFVEARGPGWSPYNSDRFQKADWMPDWPTNTNPEQAGGG